MCTGVPSGDMTNRSVISRTAVIKSGTRALGAGIPQSYQPFSEDIWPSLFCEAADGVGDWEADDGHVDDVAEK